MAGQNPFEIRAEIKNLEAIKAWDRLVVILREHVSELSWNQELQDEVERCIDLIQRDLVGGGK